MFLLDITRFSRYPFPPACLGYGHRTVLPQIAFYFGMYVHVDNIIVLPINLKTRVRVI